MQSQLCGESDLAFTLKKKSSICYGVGLKLNFLATLKNIVHINKQRSKRDVSHQVSAFQSYLLNWKKGYGIISNLWSANVAIFS